MSEAHTSPIRWSETVTELVPALVKARKNVGVLAKEETATVQTKKGQYQFKYEDLAALVEAVTPKLLDEGIFWTCTTRRENGYIVIYSQLIHTSGEWMLAEVSFRAVDLPQDVGSLQTYGRRYALKLQLGIQPHGEDDGGKQAQAGAIRAQREEAERRRQAEKMEEARAVRRQRYRKAVEHGELGAKEARAKSESFAKACFHKSVQNLTGEEFDVLCDYLTQGGELTAEYVENDIVLSEGVRAAVGQWMGEGDGGSSVLAELSRVAGPDISMDDARLWVSDIFEEDLESLQPGARLDAVRLYMYISGHESLSRAIGRLGEGDTAVGVSRLWSELGMPDVVLAKPADGIVEQLQELEKEKA